LFGRRKREDVARAEEARREAERRALFEQLAKRPETVCPFLGLADDRAGYQPEPNGEHRCYAFGDPAPLSDEQQRHVCLERGYSNCPRYLRGVLVIPTEELEALRRPQPHVPPPPPPPARNRQPAAERPRRRRWVLILPLLMVLVVAVAAGGWYLLGRNGGVGILPSASPTATPVVSGTAAPSASETALVSPTPLPTPTSGDIFVGYQVGVGPQRYNLFKVDDAGNITETITIPFSRFSHGTVEPVTAANGLRHWRNVGGELPGYSYIKGQSGDFEIRKLYRAPDGSERAVVLPPGDI
jgi:hypothetical protein